MSSFYAKPDFSSSAMPFDGSDESPSRSPSRFGDGSLDRPGSSRGYHSNASSSSLSNGGAPMHAMMVPGVVLPSIDRPDPEQPFSDWEAYIVKQTQEWSEKRAQAAASPPPQSKNGPRIVWADQIRKSAPQTLPLVYTKARDRVASPTEPSNANPRGLFRKTSIDLLRGSNDAGHSSTPLAPSNARPSISSPILTKSILTTVPPSSIGPVSAPSFSSASYDAPYTGALPEPLQVPQNIESSTSSVRSLSPLPLALSGDDFSASLLINFEKRASTSTTSSGRAPGPSELLAVPLTALLNSETSGPPSIADTYSVHSRRSSWASSVDLDPAIICTPPLSANEWQEHAQAGRPAFLAQFEMDHDSDDSETECSVYPDDYEERASLPSTSVCSPATPQEPQLPVQPVFQRLEADVISLSDFGDNFNNTQRFTPDGRPLPQLEISSLPREKEEMVAKARAHLISPRSFKKAFSIKKKNSTTGSTGSRSTESSPSLQNSSSEEVGKITESAPQTPRARMPSIVTEDMNQWAAAIPAEAPPTSPAELLADAPQAPSMVSSFSADSSVVTTGSSVATMASSDSSLEPPLSPAFSTSPTSIGSATSSINSLDQRRHRVGTPGLTKVASSVAGHGASAIIDPHLARGKGRARSSGSVSSHTPSIALSNTSSKGRRGSRRSGRSRITDSMPSFANMASSLSVPETDSRRFSNRSLSSEGSVDNHSNASNGSSYAKVGGSSDDGMPIPLSPSSATGPFKSVLRKRVPSVDSMLSPKKEVSFDLSFSNGFDRVEEDGDEAEELLEHEQRQRSHLTLPPMKLQAKQGATASDAAAETQTRELSEDDRNILKFLSTFGSHIKSVESLEALDNVHAGSNELPKREDWDSLPAYLVAYATTFLSAYADDSATLVYSDARAPAAVVRSDKAEFDSNSLYTSCARSILRVASWDQPLVSAGVCSAYAYSWSKGRLAVMLFAGLAVMVVTQGAQKESTNAKELVEAYDKLAPVLLGSTKTQERLRNLVLQRSPKASLRVALSLLAVALGASRISSSAILSFSGLLLGLAVFAWLPIILHQPEWAPEALKRSNPVDLLLYDVPTDAQFAMLTLRRRAAGGERLFRHAKQAEGSLLSTSFDHRVSDAELEHVSDVLEGAHFATCGGERGHLIVMATRVIFRAIGKDVKPVSLRDELKSDRGCRIAFDVRLEKVVALEKVGVDGLRLKVKNGGVLELEAVERRDRAFNLVVGLGGQRWH